jgi:DNA-binding transcriptional MocR family regulator
MTATLWMPPVTKADGPIYLAIADALAADILSGRLPGGTRLPPQRTLADLLGIDFTTVSRAYTEARRRGLVEGRVGHGTYVRARRTASLAPSPGGVVDMSMNLPPRFDDPGLVARMWAGIGELETTEGLDLLLRYQEPGGAGRDRAAGAAWVFSRLGEVPTDRILICPGAQGALLAITSVLAAPHDTILVEPLTYPGFLSLAAHLRVDLMAVPADADGPIPEEFDALCAERQPKAFYCNPTIHNPTTRTIPLHRRKALLAIAQTHNVPIIEDDAYGALPANPVPPFAAIAPDIVYHVAGVAKSLAPSLRIAFLVAPDIRAANRLAGAIRATASMASPLTASIATRWIEDGTANAVLDAIRHETKARQAIAAQILPANGMLADPEGFHIWVQLSPPWTRGEFVARLRTVGIGVVASDAFALNAPPEAIRLGLGAAANHDELAQSLRVVADFMSESPAISTMVV